MRSAKRLTVFCFTLGAALTLAMAGMSGSAQASPYTLTVTNATQTVLTGIAMTAISREPGAPPGETLSHAVPIGPGEKITVARPKGDVRLVLTSENGGFTFPNLWSTNEENDIEATLVLRKDTVPELRFADKTRAPMAGDNDAWKFPQILGSFPYCIGVTTKKEAMAMGAQQAPQRNELAVRTFWEGETWDVLLEFADAAPESPLRRISMAAEDPDYYLGGLCAPDVLQARGYEYVFDTTSKDKKQATVFGSELFRRVYKALQEKDHSALRPGDDEALKQDVVVTVVLGKGRTLFLLCRAGDMSMEKAAK